MEKNLAAEHRADLEKSGLTPETINKSGIYSIPPRDINLILHNNTNNVKSLMGIPYLGMDFTRYKLFPPCKLSAKDEKPRKYFQPLGSPIHLYVPPGFDPNSPIIRITEGEKKSLRGCQEGLNVCALGGIWNFAYKDENDTPHLINALAQIDWKEVEIIPDGDFQKNPSVCHAVFRLGSLLEKKGAKVRIIRLPDDSKLDDYLNTHSVEAFSELELLSLDDRIFRGAQVKEEGLILALEKSCLEATDFLKKEIPRRLYILKPLLKPGTLGMIHSNRGVGKTMFATIMAIAITNQVPIGNWEPESPAGVLYIDAEMSCDEYQKRLKQLTAGLPAPDAPLTVLSSEWMDNEGWPRINLISKEWRDAIYSFLKCKKYGVLFLDNLPALTPGIDENSSQEWADINDWMLSLRFLGCAVIMLHNEGKLGSPRGTSAREDSLDFILRLTNKEKEKGKEELCEFDAVFTKARSIFGEQGAPFHFKIVPSGVGGDGKSWIVESKGETKRRLTIAMLGSGWEGAVIASTLKISKGYISQIKKKAIKEGWIKEDSEEIKFTDAGENEFGDMDISGF